MENGILSAIGNTPLIRLRRIINPLHFRLYAKLETLNPGGSTKDRPAANIIKHGIESGVIQPGVVVIESSSGNMGIGLAQACGYYGLRFICVVDPKTASQNISIMKAYGAEIEMVTEPSPVTGEYLQARLDRVHELLSLFEHSFWPNQYSNVDNAMAHRRTMEEIETALGDGVDYLFCATSTCGTIRGCAEYAREHCLTPQIIAVDAVGSVIFGGQNAKRLIPGHGAAVSPPLYRAGLADQHRNMTDLECVVGCRRLAAQESMLVGGSSGAVIMAVDRMKNEIPEDSVCVAIFHDRGERYLDTIYSDEWVREHFGEVSHFWQQAGEVQTCLATTF
jgi:N-(2-amino-2-carboxyethyl)-L-glutamate synthase